ncbi:hypothetical protein C7974DRAFT_421633 [Boeremia exigua]|uniref:uncharacterized protein n=1 Tax=Boeremia exigua TaxID=749465 RepID=UPI001E8EB8CA|nr:uncharacterized protein C7974DRAFT_421633 [Boeremia exigua]KAH6638991.1 hypothetical protein C7974DRAFT_421633 [Boeremia exigua]
MSWPPGSVFPSGAEAKGSHVSSPNPVPKLSSSKVGVAGLAERRREAAARRNERMQARAAARSDSGRKKNRWSTVSLSSEPRQVADALAQANVNDARTLQNREKESPLETRDLTGGMSAGSKPRVESIKKWAHLGKQPHNGSIQAFRSRYVDVPLSHSEAAVPTNPDDTPPTKVENIRLPPHPQQKVNDWSKPIFGFFDIDRPTGEPHGASRVQEAKTQAVDEFQNESASTAHFRILRAGDPSQAFTQPLHDDAEDTATSVQCRSRSYSRLERLRSVPPYSARSAREKRVELVKTFWEKLRIQEEAEMRAEAVADTAATAETFEGRPLHDGHDENTLGDKRFNDGDTNLDVLTRRLDTLGMGNLLSHSDDPWDLSVHHYASDAATIDVSDVESDEDFGCEYLALSRDPTPHPSTPTSVSDTQNLRHYTPSEDCDYPDLLCPVPVTDCSRFPHGSNATRDDAGTLAASNKGGAEVLASAPASVSVSVSDDEDSSPSPQISGEMSLKEALGILGLVRYRSVDRATLKKHFRKSLGSVDFVTATRALSMIADHQAERRWIIRLRWDDALDEKLLQCGSGFKTENWYNSYLAQYLGTTVLDCRERLEHLNCKAEQSQQPELDTNDTVSQKATEGCTAERHEPSPDMTTDEPLSLPSPKPKSSSMKYMKVEASASEDAADDVSFHTPTEVATWGSGVDNAFTNSDPCNCGGFGQCLGHCTEAPVPDHNEAACWDTGGACSGCGSTWCNCPSDPVSHDEASKPTSVTQDDAWGNAGDIPDFCTGCGGPMGDQVFPWGSCSPACAGGWDTPSTDAASKPRPASFWPCIVTYWATIESGDETINIPIDDKHVHGPEKTIASSGMHKVWKWIHDKGVGDKISLQDAYDLAESMHKGEDESTVETLASKAKLEKSNWCPWGDA